MRSRLSFVVGNGQRVKFWKDKWCFFGGGGRWVFTPMYLSFPSLFAFACSKEAWMGDVWSEVEGKGCWKKVVMRRDDTMRWMEGVIVL